MKMEMVVRRSFDIDPVSKNSLDRDGAWICYKWKELKPKLCIYHSDLCIQVSRM
jgi:hypothetical protein